MKNPSYSPATTLLGDYSDVEQEYTNGTITLRKTIFGFVANAANGENEPVFKFTWQNKNFMSVSVMTYGATILSIEVPNNKMISEDIVLGFDTLEDFIENEEYNFNSILGRVPKVDKSRNDFAGLSNVNWIPSVDGVTLVLSYLSPNGDDGCPGNLLANVKYQITEDNRLIVSYRGAVDVKTPIDLSHRLYFNLAGHSAGPVELLKHVFHMNCDMVMRTKNGNVNLNGEFRDVGSTNYDLRVPQLIVVALSKFDPIDGSSFFSINNYDQQRTKHFVGQFVHRQSGRAMEIYSDQQFVTFSPCNNFPGAIRISRLHFDRCFSSKTITRIINFLFISFTTATQFQVV